MASASPILDDDIKPRRRRGLLSLPAAVAAVLTVASVSTSCGDETTGRVADIDDARNAPTMVTTNVATYISDSGYTRYHITAPVWYMYEEAAVPRWTFPKGLFLEKYNDLFRQEATLTCDSATYFSQRRLWRLDGNVRMRNTQGDKFLTRQLFWNQNERTVYSDSFIHIERSDRVIEGFGFNSNENMTRYTVRHPSGIFPVNGQRPSADSASRPVTATPAAVSAPARAT